MGLAAVAVATDPADPLAGLDVRDVPAPQPGVGDVVVDVRAAALNHHDLWTLRGVGGVRAELPRVLGSDGAGDGTVLWPVLTCGDPAACRGCRDGHPLLCRRLSTLGEARDGTLQSRVALPSGNVVAAPAHLDAGESACLASAYLTAWSMLRAAEVTDGDTVAVTGANGGVGVAALQLGAAMGLRMVAQLRRTELGDRLTALGADVVVAQDDDLKSALGGEVDVVLESVGRDTWHSSLRALRPGGTLVVTGASSGDDPSAELRRVFWRRLRILGVSLGDRSDLEDLVAFVGRTGLRPCVAERFALADARDAFRRLADGVLGKVVVEELAAEESP
jgi:NADPH:quinone reductase-like Zn-dependent oxidoreductase